jgi:hypothetical protein
LKSLQKLRDQVAATVQHLRGKYPPMPTPGRPWKAKRHLASLLEQLGVSDDDSKAIQAALGFVPDSAK